MVRGTRVALGRWAAPWLAVASIACSGTMVTAEGEAPNDAGGRLPDGGSGTSVRDGSADATWLDAFDDYVDPGCPDAPPPQYAYACNPLASPLGGCPPGEACYPYVDYPFETCGAEIYGASCFPSGVGTQGHACSAPFECAAGFVCAVSGSGTMCVRLCALTGSAACPDGQLCEPLDTPGLGGCL